MGGKEGGEGGRGGKEGREGGGEGGRLSWAAVGAVLCSVVLEYAVLRCMLCCAVVCCDVL